MDSSVPKLTGYLPNHTVERYSAIKERGILKMAAKYSFDFFDQVFTMRLNYCSFLIYAHWHLGPSLSLSLEYTLEKPPKCHWAYIKRVNTSLKVFLHAPTLMAVLISIPTRSARVPMSLTNISLVMGLFITATLSVLTGECFVLLACVSMTANDMKQFFIYLSVGHLYLFI